MLESGSNFIEADKDVVKVFHKNTNDLLKLKLVDSNDQVVSLENLELRLIHRQVKVDSE
ncbi:hypothetical protein D3C72_1989820 [compost metagenome]